MNINDLIILGKSRQFEVLEILLLLEKVLKIKKELILANKNLKIKKKEKKQFLFLIEKIKNKKIPLHYILEKKEFMGLEFKVNKSVLIPRKDTECLVEEAIDQIKKNHLKKIIDLCCGCGCIGLSIAYYFKKKVTLSDISKRVLKNTKENAKKLKLEALVDIIESNLLNSIKDKFDLIITNPPYLSGGELIKKEQKELEPKKALLGYGEDGLKISKKIIKKSILKLKKNGFLIMEAAPWQISELKNFAIKNNFQYIKTIYDLENRKRGLVLRNEL